MSKKRIASIDSLKILLYFLVICIHVISWKGKIYVLPASRIAVPIFFMISGFFINIKDINALRKHSIKMLYSFLIVVLIYVLFLFSLNYIVYHRDIVESFLVSPINGQRLISIQGILNFVFFNEVTLMPHLWYLPAYIYSLFILSFLTKIDNRYLFYLSCLILLISVYISTVWPDLNPFYYRNFIFLGIPFIIIGNSIRQINNERIKNSYLLFFIFILCISTYLEYFVLKHSGDVTFSSVLLSIFIFILTQKNANVNILPGLSRVISIYGLHIYSYHYIVIIGISLLMSKLSRFEWVHMVDIYLNPLIVYFVTICIIFFYMNIIRCNYENFKSYIKLHS